MCSAAPSLRPCSAAPTASEEQLNDIDGFCYGFAVQLFVSMRKAASLRFQCLEKRTKQRCHSEVTARREVILDDGLVLPLEARIVLLFAYERSASTQEVLMSASFQVEKQLGLHHRSGRKDLVHHLGRRHGRRILQYVEGTPPQRLASPVRQDLGKHVVRVREVRCEKSSEGSETFVHGLSHVSYDGFAAFCHWRIGGMHENMLQRFLHGRGALCSGLANEPCDRSVLQSRLLHVHLKVSEVLVGGVGQHSHILCEVVAVLFPERFRALKHRLLPYRVCSESSELWRIPPGIWIGGVAFAVSCNVSTEMVLQFLSVHKILEENTPRDLRWSLEVWRTIAVEELDEASHPSCWVEDV